MKRAGLALLAATVIALVPLAGHAAAIALSGERQQVLINLTGGLPGRWESCRALCVPGEQPRTLLGPTGGNSRLGWRVPGDEAATRELENLEYDPDVRASPGGGTLLLTSRAPVGGIRLVHRYRLGADGRTLSASLQIPAGARVEMRGGPALAGEPLPGLAAIYTDARAVQVSADGQQTLAAEGDEVHDSLLPAGEWAGIRGRFWAVLVQAGAPLRLTAS
ncbi:MAG: hypothetical protein ABI567_07570, partial [Gammaproteobacteria bacterium]